MEEDEYVETSDVEELMAEQLDSRTRQLSLDPESYQTPPRKRIKLFHDYLPVDPAGHRDSSPVPATINIVELPTENPHVRIVNPSRSQIPENSQDPLLLCSPVPAIPTAANRSPSLHRTEHSLSPSKNIMISTTPKNTPPHTNYYAVSPGLRFSSSRPQTPPATTPIRTSPCPSSSKHEPLFSPGLPPSSPSQLYFPPSPAADEGAQVLSPLPSSPDDPMSPSPFSQPPSLSRSSPPTALPASSLSPPPVSPLPSVSIPHRVPEPDPPEMPPELMAEQRYPLRVRNKRQMKPYTADKIQYEKQLRNNPDAIVNIKSIRRHHFVGDHVASDEDESQENNYAEEPGEDPAEERFWREQERRHKKVKANAPEPAQQQEMQYPGILRDDISSQEEEDEVLRDARRLARAEKRKKKQQEKEARSKAASKHRPKTFPEPAPTVSGIPSDYFNQYDDGEDNNNEDQLVPNVDHFDIHADPPNIPASPQLYREPQEPEMEEIVNNNNDDDDVVSIHSQSDAAVEMDIGPEEPNVAGIKLKILKKMYPLTMITKILKAKSSVNSKNNRQKSVETENFSDPLLPGQSRARRAVNPKDISEIKGDTESSDDDATPRRDVIDLSDSDHASGGDRSHSHPRRRLHKEKQPQAVHLVHDTSESDYVSDDDLDMYMGPLYETSGPSCRRTPPALRESSLIDYMLNRPARIGSNQNSKRRTGHSTSGGKKDRSTFRLDLTTDGARRYGKEKQTLLSFTSHGSTKGGYRPKEGSSGSHKRSKPSSSRGHGASGYHADEEERDINDVLIHHGKQASWKERQKLRKARERAAGIYCFGDGSGKVGSGRGRAAFITVDLEDETFRQALVPRSTPTPIVHQRNPLSWPRLVNLDPELRNAPGRTSTAREDPTNDPQQSPAPIARHPNHIPISSDFKLPMIPAVKGFGTSSYTGSGYLHDLLSTLAGTQTPPTPITHTFQTFDLSSSMTVSEFCALVPKIFDSYLEFASDLPSPDTNDLCRSWQKFGHVIHHYCTAFMSTGEPASYTELSECINPQLSRVVEHFTVVTLESVDLPLLQLYWFSLELSLRLSAHNGLLPSVSSGTSKDLVSCLMTLLFQFGFKDIIYGLRKGNGLEGSLTSYRVAEIWVWLIHVLDSRRVAVSNPKLHPFWEPIKAQISIFIPTTGMQASEDFWSVIFSLCILSQLNEYGMAGFQSRLPACWELVVAALRKIPLDALPETSNHTPQTRRKHESYIALLISRCNHLRDRWHWKSASYDFLNVLSSIFKSRLYANLLHEVDDYPKFFKSKSWDSYSTYDPEDTAFAHFLKIIGHAIQDSVNPATGKPSLNLKKLTSMFLPVSSLSFTKSNPPGPRAMGMLYNRICGAAVAVHLDPSDYQSKMTQARKYVSFADVDDDVRLGIVRGLMTWGTMMVSDKVGIGGITSWATEIGDVLTNELREMKAETETDNNAVKTRRRNLVVITMALVGALRQIAEAYLAISEYPEPGLLGCLKSVMTTWLWRTDTPANEFLRLNHVFFQARIAALPRPERPVRRQPVESESQDYGLDDMDWDWDAMELPDALKGDVPVIESPSWKEKEIELCKVLKDSQYKWKLRFFMSTSFKREVSADRFEQQASACDAWMKAFISTYIVEGDIEKWNNWRKWIDISVASAPDKTWAWRMVLGGYYYILFLEPKAYCIVDLKPVFITNFLSSLVSIRSGLESRYSALLLSIDGQQHPLFQNMDCLPDPNPTTGDYDLEDNFKQLRLPILRAVFRNTHRLLTEPTDDQTSMLESDRCLDYCKETLSTLRGNHTKIETTPELASEKQEYELFFGDVIDACLEFPSIRSRVDALWSDLRRNLPTRP